MSRERSRRPACTAISSYGGLGRGRPATVSARYEGTRHGLLWWFAAETGVRQGEIIALKWRNVRGTSVKVAGTYDRVSKSVGETKAAGSRRRIEISANLAAARSAPHHARLPVFPALDGRTMLDPRNLQRDSQQPKAAIRKLKADSVKEPIRRLRFHNLRYTTASQLVRAERASQDGCGASRGFIHPANDGTYSQLSEGMQAEAAAILGDVISGKSHTKPKLHVAA